MPNPKTEPPAPRSASVARLSQDHGQALRRYLAVLGCDSHRIDDLVQEVLLTALHRGFELLRAAQARTWMRTTAYNLLRNELRSERRRRSAEAAADLWQERCGDDDGEANLEDLRACLRELPARQRTLLDHAYSGDLDREGIATALGMRPNGIKTALRRVRAALRGCMERKERQR